jgi:hypothetical protein
MNNEKGVLKVPRVPMGLMDFCYKSIGRNFEKYDKIELPDELTARLIEELHRRRKLTDKNFFKLLHSQLRVIVLNNCSTVNPAVV